MLNRMFECRRVTGCDKCVGPNADRMSKKAFDCGRYSCMKSNYISAGGIELRLYKMQPLLYQGCALIKREQRDSIYSDPLAPACESQFFSGLALYADCVGRYFIFHGAADAPPYHFYIGQYLRLFTDDD